MFGNLNTVEIEELVKHELIGRIGCSADGFIYVVPVSYAYDGIYIYGYTFEGMKVNMMRKNPKVCFEVDDIRDLSNWKSVIAWGIFEELTDDKNKKEAFQKLYERVLPISNSETMRISPFWPFSIDDTENFDGIVYRIRLTEITGRYEKRSDQLFYAT